MSEDPKTVIVMCCEEHWLERIQYYKDQAALLQHDHKAIILNTGTTYLRILHPSMIQGEAFAEWDFWCRHHLSEKQLERLEETLPALCEPTTQVNQ